MATGDSFLTRVERRGKPVMFRVGRSALHMELSKRNASVAMLARATDRHVRGIMAMMQPGRLIGARVADDLLAGLKKLEQRNGRRPR